MTDRPIVFVDTETTCLGRHAKPWEIALIRREPDGSSETTRVIQVAYSLNGLPAHTDPGALHIGGWLLRGVLGSDYIRDVDGDEVNASAYADEEDAASATSLWLRGAPILVGVGVHFDAAVLGAMFARHGYAPEPWQYAIFDLKAATVGYLRGQAWDRDLTDEQRACLTLPASSERLSSAIGVEPPTGDERHTALGDARWAARWFDTLMGVDR